jgi:hypothetical protein
LVVNLLRLLASHEAGFDAKTPIGGQNARFDRFEPLKAARHQFRQVTPGGIFGLNALSGPDHVQEHLPAALFKRFVHQPFRADVRAGEQLGAGADQAGMVRVVGGQKRDGEFFIAAALERYLRGHEAGLVMVAAPLGRQGNEFFWGVDAQGAKLPEYGGLVQRQPEQVR